MLDLIHQPIGITIAAAMIMKIGLTGLSCFSDMAGLPCIGEPL